MIRKPLYTHLCRDAAGYFIGEAYVYDQLDDDQRAAISKHCEGAIVRPAGSRVEVYFPTLSDQSAGVSATSR